MTICTQLASSRRSLCILARVFILYLQKQTTKTQNHTFGAPTNTTPNPHAGVQVQVPSVASLHVHVQSKGIRLRIDLVREGWVFEFLQRLTRADAPTIGFDADEGRRVVMGL